MSNHYNNYCSREKTPLSQKKPLLERKNTEWEKNHIKSIQQNKIKACWPLSHTALSGSRREGQLPPNPLPAVGTSNLKLAPALPQFWILQTELQGPHSSSSVQQWALLRLLGAFRACAHSITMGAYFPSNSLRSNDIKYSLASLTNCWAWIMGVTGAIRTHEHPMRTVNIIIIHS